MRTKAIHLHTSTPSRGFTLTELLVVIVIIVTIAALSMTGISKMRAAADKVGSTRNLSQLQIANVSYAGDHNGKCASLKIVSDSSTIRWSDNREFMPYLIGEVLDSSGKQATTVPLSMLDPKVVRARKDEYNKIFASYGMNDTGLSLSGDTGTNSYHVLSKVPDPARTMAFSTAIDFRVNYGSRFNWKLKNQLDTRKAPGSVGAMAYRHNNKALVVYFDGHVGEMSQADMKTIDGKGGKNNPFWSTTAQ